MNVTLEFYGNVTEERASDITLPPEGYATLISIYNVLRFVEAFLSIVGNGITIAVITKYEELKTGANYLVLSLAIADLSTGLNTPIAFATSMQVAKRTVFYTQACLFKELLYQIGNTGNIFSMLAIGVDRYVAIFYPFRYGSLMTPKRGAIVVVILWSVCLGYNLSLIYAGNRIRPDSLCAVNDFLVPEAILAAQTIFAIVTIFNMLIYIRVAILAWKLNRQIRAEQASLGITDSANAQGKITKTMLLVVGLYFLFTIPALLVNSTVSGFGYPLWVYYLYHLTLLVWFANSFVNPFIYGWRYKHFRKYYKKLLGMKD